MGEGSLITKLFSWQNDAQFSVVEFELLGVLKDSQHADVRNVRPVNSA